MTISITHPTVVAVADDPAAEVGSADWNLALATSMATQRLLLRTTAGAGPFEEGTVDYGLALAAGSGKLSLDFFFKSLTANTAYTNNTTAQNWFTSGGSANVAATTTYMMEGLLLQTNGTTSHSVSFSLAGTATLTSIAYFSVSSAGAANGAVVNQNSIMVTTAAATAVIAAITTAGTQIWIRGVVRVNAAGTLIPQFTFSAAPGAGNVLANTFFRLVPIGTNTVAQVGSWS